MIVIRVFFNRCRYHWYWNFSAHCMFWTCRKLCSVQGPSSYSVQNAHLINGLLTSVSGDILFGNRRVLLYYLGNCWCLLSKFIRYSDFQIFRFPYLLFLPKLYLRGLSATKRNGAEFNWYFTNSHLLLNNNQWFPCLTSHPVPFERYIQSIFEFVSLLNLTGFRIDSLRDCMAYTVKQNSTVHKDHRVRFT